MIRPIELREIEQRRQEQVNKNIMRFIHYNNRRILHGLTPLDMPERLHWDHHPVFVHRDRFNLNTRKS